LIAAAWQASGSRDNGAEKGAHLLLQSGCQATIGSGAQRERKAACARPFNKKVALPTGKATEQLLICEKS